MGKNLIAALGRVAPQHEYLFNVPAGVGYEEVCREVPRCRAVYYSGGIGMLERWLYRRFTEPRIAVDFRPDVVLCLASRGLLDPPAPQAVLVHDPHNFYPARHYGKETLKLRMIYRYNAWSLRRALHHTQLLLCQTPVTERRMRQRYGYSSRTAICPNAVSVFSTSHSTDGEIPAALAPYQEKMKLFCLTRFYPHKNLEIIVSTFRRFRKELEGVVVIVTVAADQHANARKFLTSIERWGLSDRIINVGPLSEGALGAYYRSCQALLLPTLLESFTGTYLEAMHFGVPIVTSGLDFARGVCGDAALYFDPWDPESIKDAILQLKGDPGLAGKLQANGRSRLKEFGSSWDEVARNLLRSLSFLVSTSDRDR